MATQKHLDAPGSAAWHARRARCFNAGDASAMLGCHPSGKTRSQLLHELHTGIEREFSDFVQERVLDPGHRIEALWRPTMAEQIIGEDLQVLAFTLTLEGLSRPLAASLDAVTFMEDTLGECKSANDALRAALPNTGRDSHTLNDARLLPKGYRVQMEQQQLVVTGATKTLFSACRFNVDGSVAEERHCWYLSDAALRAEIISGWRQFDTDLATYEAPAAAAPAPVGRAPEALPALRIEVTGMVTASNLGAFREHALAVFRGINRALSTDADFADAEKTVKWCGDVEDRLKAAKQHALSQTESIDDLFRAIDEISGEARTVRLELDKLVKAEKERRRGEIVAAGIGALQQHVAALNTRLGKAYMPTIPADFGGAIKGKKSLASMEDSVSTELARAKIAANEVADRIDANLRHLREHAADFAHLFPDTAAIVQKAADDLQALVAARIAQHRAAEERRLEAERIRIRGEEEAKLRREQEQREAAERRQREEQEAAARAEQQRQAEPQGLAIADAVITAVAANVHPLPVREVVTITAPALRVGEINKRLSPLSLDAAGLAYLGFPPVGKEGAAKLYHEHDFPRICAALVAHIGKCQQRKAA